MSRSVAAVETSSDRRPVRAGPLQRAVFFAAAFAVLGALVSSTAVHAIDAAALRLALPLRGTPLDAVVEAITFLGEPLFDGLLAIALAAAWWRREGLRGLVPLLLFVGVALEALLKHAVAQPGPPNEYVRDANFFSFLREAAPYTFPSGHALRAAFLATVVADHEGRWHGLAWVVAAAVALGRAYLAAGWLSDVAAGVLLGMALAAVAESVKRRAFR